VVLRSPANLYVPKVLEERTLAGYEKHALECFLALTEKAGSGAVYDVGANVGVYALLAAVYGSGSVHAFEPFPATADAAAAWATDNGLSVVVERIALGEETGTATLYLSRQTDSSNSLNPRFRSHVEEIPVAVERLDDYVRRTGAVPAVLKIDTESTEPEVLAGAQWLLETHRPWLLVEVLWGRVEERLHAVMDPLGYTYYHLNGEPPLQPQDRIVGDRSYENLMWLLAPTPVDDALWQRITEWRQVIDASTLVRLPDLSGAATGG
jgi:FkbM family methyltransferase